jgi:GT2 family glycosyltransferase
MNAPTVSVVMSVYNGLPYLADSVDSVLRQTFADFEFIIVDDGSTDETWPSLQAYAERDRRIRLLQNPANLGYTRSLNIGLGEAGGEFVARQDADDVSMPDRFEKQVAFMRARPQVGLLGTGIQLVDQEGQTRYNPIVFQTDEELQRRLLIDFCIHHGSAMIRRVCLRQTGFYDVSLEPSEDHDLWLRLAEVAQVANLPDRLYLYRHHPSSVSRKRTAEQRLKVSLAIEKALVRRHGPALSPDDKYILARSYLQAAMVSFACHEEPLARHCLQQALDRAPGIVSANQPLEELLSEYTASWPIADGLSFYDRLFSELLPPGRPLSRLRAKLISQLHMREVFAGVRDGQPPKIDSHLWPGLSANPGWLFNRGVLALTLRSLLRRAR